MNTLQESIKRGQSSFDEAFAPEIGATRIEHDRHKIRKMFLSTFARNVATEALEAVKLERRLEFTPDETSPNSQIAEAVKSGWNAASETQSKLINNYLKGKEDEKH